MSRRTRPKNDDLQTRPSLVERLANPDDQESWNRFDSLYRELIYRFALQRRLSDAEAKDVVQETFLCVNKKVKDFHYDPALGSFRSWLLHTAQWRIADQIKKRGPARQSGPTAEDDSARTAIIERLADSAFERQNDSWDHEWRASLIETALERLKTKIPAKQFQAFELYVFKGWSVGKVAQALGINVGLVYLTKHRVAKMLRHEIRDLKSRLI